MKYIYNAIKNDIESSPEVAASILGKVPVWKRSQFVILAQIISDHLSQSALMNHDKKLTLGSTLSPITLQRFFENDYHVKTHNDLRFIKTLDKLCIFLGKSDLNQYINDNYHKSVDLATLKENDGNFPEKELVKNFCASQFDAFIDLPNLQSEKLCTYVFKDSPLCARIKIFIEDQKKNDLKFVTENNRSNYEIFEVTKISDDSDLKVVKTQEFWNLLFVDKNDQHYVINHLNIQFYFIKKFENEWKIWDNYNPDYGKILKIS